MTRAEGRHVREQALYPKPLGSGKQKPLGIVPTAAYIIEHNIALHRLNVGLDSTFLY